MALTAVLFSNIENYAKNRRNWSESLTCITEDTLFKMLIYAAAARVPNTLILRNDPRLFFFMYKKNVIKDP